MHGHDIKRLHVSEMLYFIGQCEEQLIESIHKLPYVSSDFRGQ